MVFFTMHPGAGVGDKVSFYDTDMIFHYPKFVAVMFD